MTHAELLRRDAELAMREGGMYYSGEYLSRMAIVAEGLEAENAKLRELVRDMWFWHYEGHIDNESQEQQMKHINGVLDRMRELGVN